MNQHQTSVLLANPNPNVLTHAILTFVVTMYYNQRNNLDSYWMCLFPHCRVLSVLAILFRTLVTTGSSDKYDDKYDD